jgi:GNL3L/Grn1 putative GTPase
MYLALERSAYRQWRHQCLTKRTMLLACYRAVLMMHSIPFKAQVLAEIEYAKQRAEEVKEQQKEKRKLELVSVCAYSKLQYDYHACASTL